MDIYTLDRSTPCPEGACDGSVEFLGVFTTREAAQHGQPEIGEADWQIARWDDAGQPVGWYADGADYVGWWVWQHTLATSCDAALVAVQAERDEAYESRAHWCVEAGKAMQERDEATRLMDLAVAARRQALDERDALQVRCATLTAIVERLCRTFECGSSAAELRVIRKAEAALTPPAPEDAP